MNGDAILARRVALTYRQFPLMAAASTTIAAFFAMGIADGAGWRDAGLWFALAAAVTALRIALYRAYRRSPAPGEQAPRWQRHIHAGAVAGGIVWGAAALFCLTVVDASDRIFVMVSAVSVAATGAHWHAAFPRASAAYVVAALAPFTLVILAMMGPSHPSLALASIVLIGLLIVIARRSGALILEWCVQAERNRVLWNTLEAAHGHLQSEMERRRQADERGESVERKLDLLIGRTPLATIEWDGDRRVSEWNPAAEALFGYHRTEMAGRGDVLDVIFKPEHRPQASAQWWSRTARGEGFQFVAENVTRDGRSLTCSWAVAPLMNAGGRWIGTIAQVQDVTELHDYERKLHSLAYFDALTGLPNRLLLGERLGEAIAAAAGKQRGMGLMLLDLDRFKAVNDALGHASGDRLLREAAKRLSGCVRSYDTVARLGGDEFALLLPDIRSNDDLGKIARKVVSAFSEPFRIDGRNLFVGCSVGVVMAPDDGPGAAELLRFADLAMYDAKSKGGNNFQFYSKTLSERSAERLALEGELRLAEAGRELELHYQPQVDLASGRLVGFEALLRWNHPVRGLVMPDRFIGIAEDSGLIVGIGEWVLRTACRTARAWNEGRPEGILKVAVNLSPRQFRMNDLAATLRRVLEETGCLAQWLECEITESLLLADSEEVRATLFEMRAMGVTLAIDDFGTGYSSLAYINRYPVQSIKIDRSFVRDMMTAPDSAELVKAIVAMARSLHLETVAEGVETAGQQDFLARIGCRTGQGWLYGKAVPAAEAEALLASFDRLGRAAPEQMRMFDASCVGGAAS